MSLQFRRRIRGPRLGPLRTFINLSLRGLGLSAQVGRVTVSKRGVSVRGPKGWSWRA